MYLTVLGMGTAIPEHHMEREEAAKLVIEHFARDEREKRLVPALYRMAGVEKRHSVLLNAERQPETGERFSLLHHPNGPGDRGPSMRERMDVYERRALPLAEEACGKALGESGVAPGEITHLVTVSCSGFYAPGIEVELIRQLNLRPTVERTHVGFMGCSGALNGMRVAQGFAGSRPDSCILLCAVELCSLHYYYGWDPQRIVANALFSDGAAAVVGAPGNGNAAWQVRATGSCVIPDSEDSMTWRIGDNGFLMSLSNHVPQHIEGNLRPWMEAWLGENGLKLDDVQTWAVHPGGPRILSSVAKALGFGMERLDVARGVFRDLGNMSSPTVLFILERLRRNGAQTPCVALGFGPGLVAEAVLFA